VQFLVTVTIILALEYLLKLLATIDITKFNSHSLRFFSLRGRTYEIWYFHSQKLQKNIMQYIVANKTCRIFSLSNFLISFLVLQIFWL